MTTLPVSLYFMPEWWDRHYHAARPRPSEPSEAALESLYLGRLRFCTSSSATGERSRRDEDLAIWNVDPATDPDRLRTVLRIIDAACRQHGRQPQYEPMPLCWEEMQWAHGRYQGVATTQIGWKGSVA